MSQLTCKLCGEKFDANHYNALCPNCRTRKCIICGKEFKVVAPYNQLTCSRKCAGIYRKEAGISKEVARKASETMMKRYGKANARDVTNPTEEKICPLCGKSFIPDTFRQVYCKDKHYGPCPVCGKQTEIKEIYIGPQCCSEECRLKRIKATCKERFGTENVFASDYGKAKIRKVMLSRYGVPHSGMVKLFRERAKNTMIERYGAGNALQIPEIKARVAATNMERYGGVSPTCDPDVMKRGIQTQNELYGGVGLGSHITKDKIHQSMREKYGSVYPMQIPEIRDRAIKTNIEKYGFPSPMQNESVKQKCVQTSLERYGVEHWAQNPENAKIIHDKVIDTLRSRYGVDNPCAVSEFKEKAHATNMERYGVLYYCLTDHCASANVHQRISKINEYFSSRLIQMGYAHIMEYRLDRKSYDFKLGDTLIEIDPTITHNSAFCVFPNRPPKDKNYHLMKSEIAWSHGFRCMHIFDWDNLDKIFGLFQPYIKVYARSCEIREIKKKDAEPFIEKYHIQGSCRGQYICYGLYYKDELIEVMTFGKPRYNRKYDYELLRLCTAFGYRVIGGASKLFHKFVSDHPNKSIISYCNSSKFSGDVYENIGMKFVCRTKPAKVWSKGTRFITDNVLRQRGYDQLFNTNFGKGTSNEQLMLENGWYPVYDCGQAVYEFR